jgi:hypothetical protein
MLGTRINLPGGLTLYANSSSFLGGCCFSGNVFSKGEVKFPDGVVKKADGTIIYQGPGSVKIGNNQEVEIIKEN